MAEDFWQGFPQEATSESPITILREQAEALNKKTGGLLPCALT